MISLDYTTHMSELLSWDEIKKQFDQEWVQLVDYDWPEGEPVPRAGRIRVHAPTRKEFNKLVRAQESPRDAARVYVGKPLSNPSTVISCNSMRISECK